MSNSKVSITVETLKEMAVIATNLGTEQAFMRLVLDWCQQANDEIVRLNAEVKAFKDDRSES